LWLSLEAKYKWVDAKEDLVKTFVLLTCRVVVWHTTVTSILSL
jgi:hypothetical protein